MEANSAQIRVVINSASALECPGQEANCVNLVFLRLSKVFLESGKLFSLANSVPSIISVWQFSPVGKTTDSKEIFALFDHAVAILIFMLPVIV